jgi:hypothetical protein
MTTIKELLSRIDELQQIINLESDAANLGDNRSRALVIYAENEKDEVQDRIDALALFVGLNNL